MAPGAIWPMSWEVLFGRARRLLAKGGSARTRAVVVLRRREGAMFVQAVLLERLMGLPRVWKVWEM